MEHPLKKASIFWYDVKNYKPSSYFGVAEYFWNPHLYRSIGFYSHLKCQDSRRLLILPSSKTLMGKIGSSVAHGGPHRQATKGSRATQPRLQLLCDKLMRSMSRGPVHCTGSLPQLRLSGKTRPGALNCDDHLENQWIIRLNQFRWF